MKAELLKALQRKPSEGHIDIVFDGPPSHETGRFVEVENEQGASINFGEWVHREDGYWVLRLTPEADNAVLREAVQELAWFSDFDPQLTPPTKEEWARGEAAAALAKAIVEAKEATDE